LKIFARKGSTHILREAATTPPSKLGRNWPRTSTITIYTMRLLDIEAAIGTAILLLSLPCDAKHSHRLHHLEAMGKRHDHERLHASPRAEGVSEVLEKRGSCEFPSDAGLVAVTPGSSNGGWAMSPNQPCTPGSYCPFACPPGQVMAQWSPQATSYTYPESMVRLKILNCESILILAGRGMLLRRDWTGHQAVPQQRLLRQRDGYCLGRKRMLGGSCILSDCSPWQ
jgi:hypothetical protein